MNRTHFLLILLATLILIGCVESSAPPPSLSPATPTSAELFTLPTITPIPVGATNTSEQATDVPTLIPPSPIPTSAATDARPGESGIAGVVTLGPMCPVQRQDDPCPDQPYSAVITILDANGSVVRQIASDAAGQFAVPLVPGIYTLHPEPPQGNILPRAADQVVTVDPGTFTQVVIPYDTGIR